LAICDVIYGVTMEQAGVSKRMSVRFEDVSDTGDISPAAKRAAAKKYKMTTPDLAKADQLTKASAEFETFLKGLGGLHDSVVSQLIWSPEARTLHLEIEDLYSNFEGLPEYPGALSGVIELRDVDRISFDIELSEGRLHIYDFIVEPVNGDQYRALLTFQYSGRITAFCRIVDFPHVNIPEKES
jgi:hypothetical protein